MFVYKSHGFKVHWGIGQMAQLDSKGFEEFWRAVANVLPLSAVLLQPKVTINANSKFFDIVSGGDVVIC